VVEEFGVKRSKMFLKTGQFSVLFGRRIGNNEVEFGFFQLSKEPLAE